MDLLICGHTHQYAIQPAGRNGLTFPMVIGGDVTADQMQVTSSDLSRRALAQLPPVKMRL